jgi:hypothetical protein
LPKNSANFYEETHVILKYFLAGFLPLLSKIGGRTAAIFPGQPTSFFGRF